MKINTLEYVIGAVIALSLIVIGILMIMAPDQDFVPGADSPFTQSLLLQQAGQFVQHTNTLKNVAIDTSIFTDPLFQRLRSDKVPVIEQPVGKSNLFEPATSINSGF